MNKTYIYACYLEAREMTFDGSIRWVEPFLGCEGHGPEARFGIGITDVDTTKVLDLYEDRSHQLVRAWRVLESLSRRASTALEFRELVGALWSYMGTPVCQAVSTQEGWPLIPAGTDVQGDGLATLLGCAEGRLRRIRVSMPPHDRLMAMVENLGKAGVHIDPDELAAELEAGHLADSDGNRRLIELARSRRLPRFSLPPVAVEIHAAPTQGPAPF